MSQPPPFDLTPTSWVLVVIAAALVLGVLKSGRREYGLPPGPPTLPILGNLHLLRDSYIRFSDWQLCYDLLPKFGNIMSLKLGSQTAIILQDDGASFRELFEKRGNIYSSRPMNYVMDILCDGDHPIHEIDARKWKVNRKLIVQHFRSRLSEDAVRTQEAESTQLMMELISDPENYEKHLLRFTVSVLTKLAYGHRSPSMDHVVIDGIMDLARQRNALLRTAATPPVDFWPWLSYIPKWLSPWHHRCDAVRTLSDNTYGFFSDSSRKLYDHDLLDRTTFAYKVFEQQKLHQMDDHWAMLLLAVVLEGGTDILANSICTTILALLTHPDVQAKAQMEIDKVCDEETLPTMEHYGDLPYVRCIGKESLRWRPPFPLGVPHALVQDDEYNGYKIPKGATIATNIWAVHQNPERFPNPEAFLPERFASHTLMTGDYMSNSDYLARDHFAFGTGRRSCPGVYIAEQAHILITARLLWTFDIVPVSGSQVISTDARTAYEGGSMRKPKAFPLTLRPRSQERLLVIQREMERLQEGGGPLAKQDGLLAEVEALKSFPEGYSWKPRS